MPPPTLKPLDWPPMSVQVDVPPVQLGTMTARIERVFTHLGELEPHWSVLTADKYRAENLSENKDEFFASGKDPVDAMIATLTRYGRKPSGSCFELGCGVGRITMWLARHFERVIATDISAAHLAVAREELSGRNIVNVDFVHLNRLNAIGDLPAFDVFFSVIVLQHNPPPIMRRILQSAFNRLPRHGVAYFQLPTYRLGYNFDAAEYLATQPKLGDVEMHVLPQPALHTLIAECGCRILEMREDSAAAGNNISNRLLVEKL